MHPTPSPHGILPQGSPLQPDCPRCENKAWVPLYANSLHAVLSLGNSLTSHSKSPSSLVFLITSSSHRETMNSMKVRPIPVSSLLGSLHQLEMLIGVKYTNESILYSNKLTALQIEHWTIKPSQNHTTVPVISEWRSLRALR